MEFINQEKIEKVVIGESRNFQGQPNAILSQAEIFKTELEKRGVSTIFHPEVLTTVEARRLQGNTLMTDASAAALILKNFLDSRYNNVE
jgi:RNase H-fold protein (predicted Holliday junction resolvase)